MPYKKEEPIRRLEAVGGEDHRPDTRKEGEEEDSPAWVEVDFGEVILIDSLVLQPIPTTTTTKAPYGEAGEGAALRTV